MSSNKRTEIESMPHVDLQNFRDYRLQDNGELEISPYHSHDIYLWLGGSVLKVTTELLGPEGTDVKAKRLGYPRRFTITNEETGSSIQFNNTLKRDDKIETPSEDYEVFRGNSLVLGRKETPELTPEPTVSASHIFLRTGNISGKLHVMDLDSTNGSRVHYHEEDYRAVQSDPRRTFVRLPGKSMPILKTAHQQRWMR